MEKVNSKNDIFEDMRKRIGCQFISDLPNKKDRVITELIVMRLDRYDEKQLQDFFTYVFDIKKKSWVCKKA